MMLGRLTLIFILMVAALTVDAAAKKTASSSLEQLMMVPEKWVLQAARTEPDLMLTAEAAYRHAGLDGDPAKEWRKKARQSAALPTLSLSVDTGYLNRANVSVQDSVSVNSSGVTIGPPASDSNQYLTNQTMFTAKAMWSLSEIIFHRQTLGIEREQRDRTGDRQKLLEHINQLYHERIRLKAALVGNQKINAPGRAALRAALMQVTGQLNLLTGGWFADQVKEEGHV